MMRVLDVPQGSPEWLAARAGSLGASQLGDALARTKSGWGASRANLAARLVAERLTGQPMDSYSNAAMQWGTEQEPHARAAYSFVQGVTVEQVGLVLHPRLTGTHASPDGLVGDDGLVEIKCPNTATHIATLKGAGIEDRYVKQMQWQMLCCDRMWCDFVSYDPRLGVELQIHIRRIERHDALLATLEAEVAAFLGEVEADVAYLTNMRAAA